MSSTGPTVLVFDPKQDERLACSVHPEQILSDLVQMFLLMKKKTAKLLSTNLEFIAQNVQKLLILAVHFYKKVIVD